MFSYINHHRIEMVALLGCVALILFIFELVRRQELKEKYSFLWFATAGSLLVLTLHRGLLEKLSALTGVVDPPNALFLVFNFYLMIILIHYSTVLSQLLSHNQKVAQRLALLEAKIEHEKLSSKKLSENPSSDDMSAA